MKALVSCTVSGILNSDTFPSQGLKKTITTMDREHPRSAHSINNRNELRNVLHLHSLYKQNKVRKGIVLPKMCYQILWNQVKTVVHVKGQRTLPFVWSCIAVDTLTLLWGTESLNFRWHCSSWDKAENLAVHEPLLKTATSSNKPGAVIHFNTFSIIMARLFNFGSAPASLLLLATLYKTW